MIGTGETWAHGRNGCDGSTTWPREPVQTSEGFACAVTAAPFPAGLRIRGRGGTRPAESVSELWQSRALAASVLLLASLVLWLGPGAPVSAQRADDPARQEGADENAGGDGVEAAAGQEAQGDLDPDWTWAPDEVLPRDEAVRIGELPNGLRYYVRSNGRPEDQASLRLVVRAGSVLEDEDQLGLAHFVEHMAFNGTRNFEKQELIDYLEGVGMRFGADLNAYTSFDETVYSLDVPTDDPEVLDTAFLVFEDWASGVSFDDDEIENERGIVIEEWRARLGAGNRRRDAEIPYRFHGSRYAERMPIGDPEILREAPPQRLRDFYQDWYRPDLMAIIAVGDFDAAEVEAAIRGRFASLRGPESPRPHFEADVPPHEETLVSVFTDPELSGSSVTVTWKGARLAHVTVADSRRRLIRGLYHAMLNNRLAERAEEVDPPFLGATSLGGVLARTRSQYSLFAGAREGEHVRALEALLTEARRVERHGFQPSELERAKVNTLRSMDRAWDERDKTESRVFVGQYLRNFLDGEPFPSVAYEREMVRRLVPEIELADVNAVAETLIRNEDRVVLVSGPEKDGLEPPTEEELLAAFERVGQVEVAAWEDDVAEGALVPSPPEPGRIVERSEIEELGVTQWRLSNGVRVVLRPSDYRNDEILVRSFSPGGTSLVSDEDLLEASLAPAVVRLSGLGGFSLTQLNKALAGKVAQASASIGPLFESISGRGSPKDVETLFELIYLAATAPRRDDEAYESFLTRQGAMLRNRAAIPRYAFIEALQKTLTGNHPRRPMLTEEMLADLDHDRIHALYEERFGDFSDYIFFLGGNFELEAIAPLVETWLGGLPSTGRVETWKDEGVRTPAGRIERTVHRGLEQQSEVALIFNGPFEQSRLNRYRLGAMAELLEDRLLERLREDLGGTYTVGAGGGAVRIPVSTFQVQISFRCDPERVEELLQAVDEEIDRLRDEPATEEEVNQIREQQRLSREEAMETNGFWLGALQTAYRYGEDPLMILKQEELYEALSADMIQGAARDYLGGENRIKVLLMPEAEEAPEEVEAAEAPEKAAGAGQAPAALRDAA